MDFIMENEYLKVTVTTWGAQIKSVIRKCDGVEHIWQADPGVWGYHGPTMFPYVDSIKGGVLTIDGVDYPAPLHGFAQGMERKMVKQGEHYVEMELTDSPETMKFWPFKFRLVSRFELVDDSVKHILRVENTGDVKLPFGIGYHPGFALPFDDKHTVDDYEIRFEKLESPLCAKCEGNLPDIVLYPLGGRNIRSLPISREFFKGPSHTIMNLASNYVCITEKDTGRRVKVQVEGFPYTLFWTHGSRGGNEKIRFMCVETWCQFPERNGEDHDFRHRAHTEILEPNTSWSTELKMSFER